MIRTITETCNELRSQADYLDELAGKLAAIEDSYIIEAVGMTPYFLRRQALALNERAEKIGLKYDKLIMKELPEDAA